MFKIQSEFIVLSTIKKLFHDKTMHEPARRVLLIRGVFGLFLPIYGSKFWTPQFLGFNDNIFEWNSILLPPQSFVCPLLQNSFKTMVLKYLVVPLEVQA